MRGVLGSLDFQVSNAHHIPGTGGREHGSCQTYQAKYCQYHADDNDPLHLILGLAITLGAERKTGIPSLTTLRAVFTPGSKAPMTPSMILLFAVSTTAYLLECHGPGIRLASARHPRGSCEDRRTKHTRGGQHDKGADRASLPPRQPLMRVENQRRERT